MEWTTNEDVYTIHKILSDLEKLAEDALLDKHHLIELDQKQQHNRQAVRQIMNINQDKQVWVLGGSFFFRERCCTLQKMIEKEQQTISEERTRLNKEIKEKIKKINETEGIMNEVAGFSLKPLSQEDLRFIYGETNDK
eukprot:TRINITY_DN27939_c0_g1_i1.p1 TRINITY_DN27939_c0_g1~~TRINITY_DN27939_c0_g1_i1.p1  ORF type:complete len:138 (-),score=31.25 TRINITY_DN27939_c0_g1_i1:75-488(-)